MSQAQGWSLRTKVMFLLTSLPTGILAVYVYMAISVFQEDKIAYVFDSSAAVARSTAAQVHSEILATLHLVRPLVQESIREGRAGRITRETFAQEPALEYLGYFSPIEGRPGSWQNRLEVEGPEGVANVLAEHPEKSAWLQDAQRDRRVVRSPFGDSRLVLLEAVSGSGSSIDGVLLVLYNFRSLNEAFQSSAGYRVFLVSEELETLMGPTQGRERLVADDIVPRSYLLQMADGIVTTGSGRVEGYEGEGILASFARVGFAGLHVTSFVREDLALAGVHTLIRRSVAFFALLIFVALLVALFASRGVTSSLQKLYEATRSIAQGKFDLKVDIQSNDEVGVLAHAFNQMSTEVARLMDETKEKARMASEIQTAQTVQERLFPEPIASLRGLNLSGVYEPASECGGDWWHYCTIRGKHYLWIGDATGHGVGAALITSAAKSAASVLENWELSPSEVMELLNRSIYDVSKGQVMMTFFVGCYDPESKVLRYSNASHEPPILIRPRKEPLRARQLEVLNEVTGLRLGQMRESKYKEASIQLQDLDILYLYTDGVPDLPSPSGQVLGERQHLRLLVDSVKEYPNPEVAVRRLEERLAHFRGGAELQDDITYFIAQVGERL